MINSINFSDRLEKVMKFYGLSASAFADKVGVQRSSISHILSGRNKPSLDFVMKVLSSFEEVDLYWLLNGKGQFPSESENKSKKVIDPELPEINVPSPKISMSTNEIDRIVVFFKDGSFKNYSN